MSDNANTEFILAFDGLKKDGQPWFVGLDVCRALDISKPHQALDRLDEDERGTCIIGTPGGDQSAIVISEAGVYRLVFASGNQFGSMDERPRFCSMRRTRASSSLMMTPWPMTAEWYSTTARRKPTIWSESSLRVLLI